MFLELTEKLKDVENKLYNINNKEEKINCLLDLELELEKIINKEIKYIEVNYGLDEYLKNYNLQSETYDSYIKKYNKTILEDKYTYELAPDYKEYKIFDGYKYFAQEILNDMDIESNEYENEVFYIRPYNWQADVYGGCNCGLEDKVNEIYQLLDDNVVKADICSKGFHARDCKEWNVVFYYKPTGLKIKMECESNMFENSISNHPLNEEILKGILNHCKDSL